MKLPQFHTLCPRVLSSLFPNSLHYKIKVISWSASFLQYFFPQNISKIHILFIWRTSPSGQKYSLNSMSNGNIMLSFYTTLSFKQPITSPQSQCVILGLFSYPCLVSWCLHAIIITLLDKWWHCSPLPQFAKAVLLLLCVARCIQQHGNCGKVFLQQWCGSYWICVLSASTWKWLTVTNHFGYCGFKCFMSTCFYLSNVQYAAH